MNGSEVPVTVVVIQAVLAAGLIAVGVWGVGAAPDLPPAHLSDEERAQRSVVYARGAVACEVAGWILAATVLWFILGPRA